MKTPKTQPPTARLPKPIHARALRVAKERLRVLSDAQLSVVVGGVVPYTAACIT